MSYTLKLDLLGRQIDALYNVVDDGSFGADVAAVLLAVANYAAAVQAVRETL